MKKEPRKKFYWYEKRNIPIAYEKDIAEAKQKAIEDAKPQRPSVKKYQVLWALSRISRVAAWLSLIVMPILVMVFPSWLAIRLNTILVELGLDAIFSPPKIALQGAFIGIIFGCLFWIAFYVAAEWIEIHIDRNRMLSRLIQLTKQNKKQSD